MKSFKPRKNSLRLKGWNYNLPGLYFVTLVIQNRQKILGRIENGKMLLSTYGEIAFNIWKDIPNHYENVEIDEYIIMPDHLHGIIGIISPTGDLLGSQGHGRAARGARAEHCSAPCYQEYDALEHIQELPASDYIYSEQYGLVSKIIKSFKEVTVKTIRREYQDHSFKWQRNYHDRIIRDEISLNNIRKYIIANPLRWEKG